MNIKQLSFKIIIVHSRRSILFVSDILDIQDLAIDSESQQVYS